MAGSDFTETLILSVAEIVPKIDVQKAVLPRIDVSIAITAISASLVGSTIDALLCTPGDMAMVTRSLLMLYLHPERSHNEMYPAAETRRRLLRDIDAVIVFYNDELTH